MTGVALCPEGCGDSAGDGGLLEDCLVSLFVRLCCKSALICFIARVCSCSDDALVQLYPQKEIENICQLAECGISFLLCIILTVVG